MISEHLVELAGMVLAEHYAAGKKIVVADVTRQMLAAVLPAARAEWEAGYWDAPACRSCGCTEELACPGGCAWVEDPLQLGDLCSACAPIDAATIAQVAHTEGLDGWAATALVQLAWLEEVPAYLDPAHDDGISLWRPTTTITVRDGLL